MVSNVIEKPSKPRKTANKVRTPLDTARREELAQILKPVYGYLKSGDAIDLPYPLTAKEYCLLFDAVHFGEISHGQFVEVLVNRNLQMAYKVAAQTRIPGMETMDIFSELVLSLGRTARAFDISRGWQFSTFAFGSMLNVVRALAVSRVMDVTAEGPQGGSYMRCYSSLKHKVKGVYQDGSVPGRRGDIPLTIDQLCPMDHVFPDMDLNETLQTVFQNLDSRLRAVIEWRLGLRSLEDKTIEFIPLGGVLTCRAVAAHLGLSYARVQQLEKEAFLKLRLMLLAAFS